MIRHMLCALVSQLRILLSGPLGPPLGVVALLAVLAAASWGLPGAVLVILTTVLINILLALSLYVLTGLAGQVSLGHAGFVGVGAYASALLIRNQGLAFPLAVALATLASGLAGLLLSLPAGKLRMVHMAVITLAFGLIAQETAVFLTQRANNPLLIDLPSAALGNLTVLGSALGQRGYFLIVLAVTAIAAVLVNGLTRSVTGRALAAIRADEVAAGTLGIPRIAMKRLAYTLSGALAGLAGAFYVHLVGAVSPATLDVSQSIEVLVIVLVGGLGSMAGQFISAALITVLPELLQAFMPYRYPHQLLLYGSVLALTLIVAPRGIGGLFRAPRFIASRSLRLAGSGQSRAIPPMTGRATNAGLAAGVISLEFGGLIAVDKASVTLQPGRVTALIGPNGAGKTSLINTLTGIYQPSGGRARFFGRTITHKPAHIIAAYGLRRSFQTPRLVQHFTVRENLLLGAHRRLLRDAPYFLLGLPFAIRDEANILRQINALMDLAGLADMADRTIDTLGHGARRLTEITRLLAASPRTVLLDEPSAGLSDGELAALVRMIHAMKQAGIIVMLVEPHLDFVAPLVDDVVAMAAGQVIFKGDIADMRANADMIAAHHGAAAGPLPETSSAEITHA